MKWKITTKRGREFTVKAEDKETAEIVAVTCLKKGEVIDIIEEVKEGENVKEEEEKEKSEGRNKDGGEETEEEGSEEEKD